MLNGKAENIFFLSISIDSAGLVPFNYRTQDEHTDRNTIDVL